MSEFEWFMRGVFFGVIGMGLLVALAFYVDDQRHRGE